jgi:hypothetical protein
VLVLLVFHGRLSMEAVGLNPELKPAPKHVSCQPVADGELQLTMGWPGDRQHNRVIPPGAGNRDISPSCGDSKRDRWPTVDNPHVGGDKLEGVVADGPTAASRLRKEGIVETA